MTKAKPTIECIAEGLAIVAKYPGANVCAEHDEVFAGADDGTDGDPLSADDRDRMRALGWTWDALLPSWHRFV